MTHPLNETHDPARRSFLDSANAPDADFPIQNLPFGVFRPAAGAAAARRRRDRRPGARRRGGGSGAFTGPAAEAARACAAPQLNALMALGPQAWSALRLAVVARA